MDRRATGARKRHFIESNGLSTKLHIPRATGLSNRSGGIAGRRELSLGDLTRPMRIMVVTDAWQPQVNGVVRTLETLGTELKRLGHEVSYITPDAFSTVPMPTYPEIKLAVFARRTVARLIADFNPDSIHIATEGPIGLAARRYCQRSNIPFTTSFHTRFPDYVHARFGVPVAWTYRALRWFHAPASAVMVATRSLERELKDRGFGNLRLWSRGVDVELFRPGPKEWLDLPRPVHLYVGRVAVEKNVEAFLQLDLPGSKLVVGNGPQLAELKVKYPEVRFAGPKFGKKLARYYAASDVFEDRHLRPRYPRSARERSTRCRLSRTGADGHRRRSAGRYLVGRSCRCCAPCARAQARCLS